MRLEKKFQLESFATTSCFYERCILSNINKLNLIYLDYSMVFNKVRHPHLFGKLIAVDVTGFRAMWMGIRCMLIMPLLCQDLLIFFKGVFGWCIRRTRRMAYSIYSLIN